MAVTIKDIAKAAGVSHTTVSRALKGNQALSSATIKRIQQISADLGYVPDNVARRLKTKRSNILGIIVRRIGDPYFSEVQRGIDDALHPNNYRMIIASSKKDRHREAEIVRSMSEHRVDGVIICSSQVSETQREKLEQFGMPTVLINNQADKKAALSVRHDDVHGSRTIVKHLIGLGHQRIAYLGHAHAGRTNANRLAGYQLEMAAAGLDIIPDYLLSSINGAPENGKRRYGR